MKKIVSLALCLAVAGAGMQHARAEALQPSETESLVSQGKLLADKISKLELQKLAIEKVIEGLHSKAAESMSSFKKIATTGAYIGLLAAAAHIAALVMDGCGNGFDSCQKEASDKSLSIINKFFYGTKYTFDGYCSVYKKNEKDDDVHIETHKCTKSSTASGFFDTISSGFCGVCPSFLVFTVVLFIRELMKKNGMNESEAISMLEEEIALIDTQIVELKQAPQICSGLPFLPADNQTEVAPS